MKLILNEQEVVDGICIYIANEFECVPEDVNVEEVSYHKNGNVTSEARCMGRLGKIELAKEEIIDGIGSFLVEFHCFNPEAMNIELNYTEGQGIWAEVLVNE